MNNTNDRAPKKLDPFCVEFGARIAARRKQLGLTQERASEKADLSHQFLACVERGFKNMRAKNVIKMAAALDVSTDYLLLGIMNETDDKRITAQLQMLTSEERFHLEELIKHYMWACGYNV